MAWATAVWIDRSVAKIFPLEPVLDSAPAYSEECLVLHSHRRDHHTHSFDHLDQERMGRRLYEEVVPHLSPGTKLVILGPGMARFHFQNYLRENHPLLGRRVLACEAIDHLTDGQIAAKARAILEREDAKQTAT